MKTIIAGSRTITGYRFLLSALTEISWEITAVVSGCAQGVDRLGERYASENLLKIKHFPADWEKYGRRAGYIRNNQMAAYAEALLAIWDGTSRGTKNMIRIANNKGLKVYVYRVKKR